MKKNIGILLSKLVLLCTVLASCTSSQILTSQAPPYPEEALRYGLEGDVVVEYYLNNEGRAENVRVTKSSGWKILDDATVASTRNLHFPVGSGNDAPAKTHKIKTSWKLNNVQASSPSYIIPGSCAKSERFIDFRNSKEGDGLLVRFLTDVDGRPFGIKIEDSAVDQVTIDSAVAFIQNCSFTLSINLHDRHIVVGSGFARLISRP
jgi:TonB family protein